MKVCVLASGSEGNVTYVETKNHKILIDVGTNLKYISTKLSELNVAPSDIDYILISHTHDDHIKALKTFLKKNHPQICLTFSMLNDLIDLKDYERLIIFNDDINLDDCTIKSIKTSHDTNDSRGFIITENNKSVVYLTDTGYLNHKYFQYLSNKEVYLIESNHDIEMLINGPYPKWLKTRVVGPYGHLSNQDSAIYMSKLIGPNTKEILLMHLSHKNNTEELALNTINQVFSNNSIEFNNIKCARQKEKSEVIEIW